MFQSNSPEEYTEVLNGLLGLTSWGLLLHSVYPYKR